MSNKLKELRDKKGITQKECSEDTGVSMRAITRYENGHQIGSPAIMRRLAAYFEVSMDYLAEINE